MNHEPDAFEKRLRWGCGFVFGATVTSFVALREVPAFTGTFWAIVVGAALLSGFLARRHGDTFWHRLADLGRWWT